MHDPNKHNPRKLDISKLKLGLSRQQSVKIAYECDLLRISTENLITLAPFLFIEGVTSANTTIIKPVEMDEDGDDSIFSTYYSSNYL